MKIIKAMKDSPLSLGLPLYDPLRDEQRFQDLLLRMNLPEIEDARSRLAGLP